MGTQSKKTASSKLQNNLIPGYELLDEIGKGGMAVVYKGMQLSLSRPVAIKFLNAISSDNSEIIARFERESLIIARLANPYIIHIIDRGIASNGMPYFIMEYVQGTDLSIAIQTGSLNFKQKINLLAQVCEALAYAHKNGVIHRDIKPSNILIDGSGNARLLDFGIAQFYGDDYGKLQVTQANIVMGTLQYMSPEQQISSGSITFKSDIYSIGVLMYELCTGARPMGRFKSPSELIPEFSSELSNLIMSCLEPEPNNRPESTDFIKEKLLELRISDSFLSQSQLVGLPDANFNIPTALSNSSKDDDFDKTIIGSDDEKIEEIKLIAPQEDKKEFIEVPKVSEPPKESKPFIKEEVKAIVPQEELTPKEDLKPIGKVEIKIPEILKEVKSAKFASPIHDPKDIINTILKRMEGKNDFPAFLKNTIEVDKVIKSDNTSSSEIANKILNDFALTNKLLKLVNSSFYGHFQEKVRTVSRAVIMLGCDQIKLAMSSLKMFDHMQNNSNTRDLKDATVSSFVSGLIAKEIAAKKGFKETEEVFICSMMHNLGILLVIHNFPDEFMEINKIIESKKIDKEKASKEILGISYSDIGMGVGRAWNMPDEIVKSMKEISPEEKKTKLGMLRNISTFSNELCEIVAEKEDPLTGKDINEFLSKYKDSELIKNDEEISKILNSTFEKVNKNSKVLKIDISRSRLLTRIAKNCGIDIKEYKEPSSEEEPEDKSVIVEGIENISNLLMDKYEINDILLVILEIMYRGFDFTRVLLCFKDVKNGRMTARYGLGRDVESVIEKFKFRIRDSNDIFNQCIYENKDAIIHNINDVRVSSLVPYWYRSIMPPETNAFAVYPISVKDTVIGMFYMDKEKESKLTANLNHLQYLKILRNQATMSFNLLVR
ncbi:MAG: HDOD domain-containing protein [Desulfobacterales bacterium]|nr:HDOD domain-containing protein [Desulfobacterales bacterium]